MTDRNRERNPGTGTEPEPATPEPEQEPGPPFRAKKKASKRWCGGVSPVFWQELEAPGTWPHLTPSMERGLRAFVAILAGCQSFSQLFRVRDRWVDVLNPKPLNPKPYKSQTLNLSAEGGVDPRPGASCTFWRSGFSEAGPLPLGVLLGFGFQLACMS